MKNIASLPHRAGDLRALALLILLTVMGLGPASAKHAVPITVFGTVIDQPGKYILTADLFAGGLAGPAITIEADHVHLDLNGYTIEGNGNKSHLSGNFGIYVAGTEEAPLSHIHISNGRVTGFYVAVSLNNASNCHVKKMTVESSAGGIELRGSSKNHIKENVATANARGISVVNGSNANHIQKNDCSQNTFEGIALVQHDGAPCTGNQVKQNTFNENGLVGIWLVGECDENQIKHNEIMGTGGHPFFSVGIALGNPLQMANLPAGNEIKNNVVLDNITIVPGGSWDLFDNSVYQGVGCLNEWKNNVFDIDSEVGADAGPGVGCIQ